MTARAGTSRRRLSFTIPAGPSADGPVRRRYSLTATLWGPCTTMLTQNREAGQESSSCALLWQNSARHDHECGRELSTVGTIMEFVGWKWNRRAPRTETTPKFVCPGGE